MRVRKEKDASTIYRVRMPAEWEPHAATWIAWPHNRTDWPGKFDAIPWVYAEITRWLASSESVRVIVRDAAHEREARRALRLANVDLGSVAFHRWSTNRGWLRDSGPIFVRLERVGGKASPDRLLAFNWRFSAWAKYSDWKLDNQLPGRIARATGVPDLAPTWTVGGRERQVVLEGGSIDVNGRGTLLTTEECLLSRVQQRNPGFSRQDWEQVFGAYLGAPNVIWLGKGIVGDDTHGHIDDLARFVGPRTVATVVEGNRRDENYASLQANLKRLRAAADQDGRPLEVVDLPMPRPVVFHGVRLPASYANFYIANRSVLVPVFNDPHDRVALELLEQAFPGRTVVGIYCGDLVWGLGTIHCMTQQQPAI